MKRLLYFVPSILVLGFLLIVLLAMPDPSADPQDYIAGAGILLVFLISDFLLFRKLWFGCIPGALLGAYVIYYGSQYHGQVMDTRAYNYILSKADSVKYITDTYRAGCMHERNRALVDGSDVCVAYLERSVGGSAYTYTYALKNDIEVINIYDKIKNRD